MEVKEVQSKFKPRLVQFNQEGYNSQCKIAQQKLELLEQGKQLALENLTQYVKVYKGDVANVTSQAIIGDFRSNTLKVNPRFFD